MVWSRVLVANPEIRRMIWLSVLVSFHPESLLPISEQTASRFERPPMIVPERASSSTCRMNGRWLSIGTLQGCSAPSAAWAPSHRGMWILQSGELVPRQPWHRAARIDPMEGRVCFLSRKNDVPSFQASCNAPMVPLQDEDYRLAAQEAPC